MSQNHDASLNKKLSFNNQQASSFSLPDGSSIMPLALSHQQLSPPRIDTTDQYMSLESRVSSFTHSWPHTAGKLTPQHMAMAGFLYVGELVEHYQRESLAFRLLSIFETIFNSHKKINFCVKWFVRQCSFIWVIVVVADVLAHKWHILWFMLTFIVTKH